MPISLAAAALCIASVHDGDTIRTCEGERIRLFGIDAPELKGSARCAAASQRRLASSRNPAWCDFQLGTRSRDALSAFLGTGEVAIARRGQDKFGRTLATLSVNGHDVGLYLVSQGLARPWR